ncbi:hypothetical protein JCM16303_001655 [Sporobolomyces ruberrimus]
MSTERTTTAFDSALAGTLFPRLINLSNLSTTASAQSSQVTGASDVEARAAKLELNKQASQLRTSLTTLQQQANELEAGEMSLEDQDWLIEELEKELVKKREELKKMVELTSFTVKSVEGKDEKENDAAGEDQEMQNESRMAAALKARGNAHFAHQGWDRALELYTQALKVIDEADEDQRSALLSNRSACYIHLNQFAKAFEDGQLCLKLRPEWSKAYARCGEANSRQCNFEYAKIAYTEALRYVEDEATKARYIAPLKLVEEKQAELLSSSFKPSSTRTLMQAHHDTWIHKAYEVQA